MLGAGGCSLLMHVLHHTCVVGANSTLLGAGLGTFGLFSTALQEENDLQ